MYCAIDNDNHKLIAVHSELRVIMNLITLYDCRYETEIHAFDCIVDVLKFNVLSNKTIIEILKSADVSPSLDRFTNLKVLQNWVQQQPELQINPFLLEMQVEKRPNDNKKYQYNPSATVPLILEN